ncbi:carbohydrate ABC transporter permease [Micromonospora carbonacea]|uniref:Carbohydrate ABC transporter permease n=1 Tax=Micromonospora carbonacea TaxID=47853 RepID=A0A7H8XK38_9ACTN|nr:carbohydrate ABC transporter permease [Micromonospora carbonacea]MBB5827335.1 multiple sugar transport system permease protein [Micromonospora carbonacea]QLD24888.1 carbohydrate ABC transporter permease [Micromonospora carbonacea]
MVTTTAALATGRGRSRHGRLGRRIRIGGAVAATVVFLFPVLWMISTSLKLPRDIFASPPRWFSTVTWENYTSYFAQADIGPRMVNTVIVAVGAGLLSITAGSMAGYALARLPIRGAGLIGGLILASRGVPPIALAVPMFLVARRFDLTDRHITLILAYCTFLIPYVMWLMRSFFLGLPKELEESAMLDGASRLGAFFRIIVPCSLPGLISTLIFSIILAWEELLFALVLTNRDAATIPVAIAGMAADTEQGAMWGPLTAVGTLTVIPVVVFALLVQKWLIKGLAEGATKG